ncbi:MAG TPA: MerR family transcriptional regulator [Clostridiales bacterium]|nr:MerR family transcriptional regulator [Clostridiales bacterium]HQP70556.1 MerR family transcriptional regulator [Clostridiales bacterium]
MLKIGDFSKLCRTTVKTLRYYDEIGLVTPDLISRENGYRYYKPEKLALVSEIRSLKEMGFSLEEISSVLTGRPDAGELMDILEIKKRSIENSIVREQNSVSQLKKWISELKTELEMEKVTIKQLPDIIAATYRKIIPDFNYLYTMAPEMGDKMRKQGVVCREPAYCFNIYHDPECKDKDIDVEIVEAVVKKLPDADGIIYKEMKGFKRAACIYHRGPYENFGRTYSAVFKWIEDNKLEIIGQPRESYIDGCWNKEDPNDWLTEIQVPVK